jgi:hypothetical protein
MQPLEFFSWEVATGRQQKDPVLQRRSRLLVLGLLRGAFSWQGVAFVGLGDRPTPASASDLQMWVSSIPLCSILLLLLVWQSQVGVLECEWEQWMAKDLVSWVGQWSLALI